MLAALLVLAQGPAVTLRLDGAHSSAVLAALSAQAGVTMRPAGEAVGDFLAVKLTAVPLEEAKRLLATTLDAEWVFREGVHYLERGIKQRLRIKKEEDEGIRRSIVSFLEKNPEQPLDKDAIRKGFVDLSDPKRTQTSQQEAMTVLQRFRPETRLGARVVRALGADAIAGATEERPLRYFQFADGTGNMNNGVKSALKSFDSEQVIINDISASLGSPNFFGGVPVGQSTDFAIMVTRNRGTVRIQLNRRTTQNGQITSSFSSEIASFNGRANNGLPGPRPNVQGLNRPFELSAPAKSLVRCLNGDPTRTRDDTAAAVEVAKGFAANDPHALYGAQPLVQGMKDFDYIALLPDSVLTNPTWARSSELSQVYPAWSGNMAMGQDQRTKVVLVRASSPFWSRESRYDRHAIARLAADVDRAKRPTLDALGTLAYVMNDSREFAVTYRLMQNVLSLDQNVPDYVALKAWGSLNASQKRGARGGGYVILLSKLPIGVRDALKAELVSAGNAFSSEPSNRVIWNASARNYSGRTNSGMLFIAGEVPANAEVRVVVYSGTLLRAAPGPRNPGNSELLTAQQLAQNSRQQSNEWNPDYKNAAVVNAERLQVEVFSPGAGYSHFVAQIDDATRDTKYVPLAQLPEPYRSQVAAELNRRGG